MHLIDERLIRYRNPVAHNYEGHRVILLNVHLVCFHIQIARNLDNWLVVEWVKDFLKYKFTIAVLPFISLTVICYKISLLIVNSLS